MVVSLIRWSIAHMCIELYGLSHLQRLCVLKFLWLQLPFVVFHALAMSLNARDKDSWRINKPNVKCDNNSNNQQQKTN